MRAVRCRQRQEPSIESVSERAILIWRLLHWTARGGLVLHPHAGPTRAGRRAEEKHERMIRRIHGRLVGGDAARYWKDLACRRCLSRIEVSGRNSDLVEPLALCRPVEPPDGSIVPNHLVVLAGMPDAEAIPDCPPCRCVGHPGHQCADDDGTGLRPFRLTSIAAAGTAATMRTKLLNKHLLMGA